MSHVSKLENELKKKNNKINFHYNTYELALGIIVSSLLLYEHF